MLSVAELLPITETRASGKSVIEELFCRSNWDTAIDAQVESGNLLILLRETAGPSPGLALCVLIGAGDDYPGRGAGNPGPSLCRLNTCSDSQNRAARFGNGIRLARVACGTCRAGDLAGSNRHPRPHRPARHRRATIPVLPALRRHARGTRLHPAAPSAWLPLHRSGEAISAVASIATRAVHQHPRMAGGSRVETSFA